MGHEAPGVQPPRIPTPAPYAMPEVKERKPRLEIELTHDEKRRLQELAVEAGVRKLARYARLVLLRRRLRPRGGGVPRARVLAFAERILVLAESGDLAAIAKHAESVLASVREDDRSRHDRAAS